MEICHLLYCRLFYYDSHLGRVPWMAKTSSKWYYLLPTSLILDWYSTCWFGGTKTWWIQIPKISQELALVRCNFQRSWSSSYRFTIRLLRSRQIHWIYEMWRKLWFPLSYYLQLRNALCCHLLDLCHQLFVTCIGLTSRQSGLFKWIFLIPWQDQLLSFPSRNADARMGRNGNHETFDSRSWLGVRRGSLPYFLHSGTSYHLSELVTFGVRWPISQRLHKWNRYRIESWNWAGWWRILVLLETLGD